MRHFFAIVLLLGIVGVSDARSERKATAAQLGELARAQHEVFNRVQDGSLSVTKALDGLRALVAGDHQAAVGRNDGKATYRVAVSYQLGLAEMVKRGKYDWVSSGITPENFPLNGKGEVAAELVLVHFDKYVTSEQARARMKDQGLEPARIEHLLALGETNPELQRKFPIVALGSVVVFADGGRLVPCLSGDADERRLHLSGESGDWNDGCRFLAFRK